MATGCNSCFDNFKRQCIGELEYRAIQSISLCAEIHPRLTSVNFRYEQLNIRFVTWWCALF